MVRQLLLSFSLYYPDWCNPLNWTGANVLLEQPRPVYLVTLIHIGPKVIVEYLYYWFPWTYILLIPLSFLNSYLSDDEYVIHPVI